MTGKVYLLGWPVGHSLSPGMQEAAFRALGLDWHYSVLGVKPGDLERVLRDISADPAFRGANVTVPHKTAVLGLLPEADPLALAVGAVNVISRCGERALRGHNTDGAGFLGALRVLGFDANAASCLVLGAGGAARACVAALGSAGAAAVRVFSRRPDQAARLTGDLSPFFAGDGREAALSAGGWAGLRAALAGWAEMPSGPLNAPRNGAGVRRLLVNATPSGMWPQTDSSPLSEADVAAVPEGTVVLDLVYNPRRTRLVEMAAGRGLAALGGGEMLLQQGVAALGCWLGDGIKPDVEAEMRSALALALEGGFPCSAS